MSQEETPEVERIRGSLMEEEDAMEPHLWAPAVRRGPPAWGAGTATGKGAGGAEARRGPGWPGWLVES